MKWQELERNSKKTIEREKKRRVNFKLTASLRKQNKKNLVIENNQIGL